MSAIEYDLACNSNLSSQVGAQYSGCIVIVWAFYVFPCMGNTKLW